MKLYKESKARRMEVTGNTSAKPQLNGLLWSSSSALSVASWAAPLVGSWALAEASSLAPFC